MREFLINYNIYSLIIDILVIILILYNIIKSAKQGFISSVVSLILTVISFIFVWPLSEKISSYIYISYFKDFISGLIETKLSESGATLLSIKNFLNQDFLGVNLNNLNLDDKNLINSVSNIISDKFVFPVINIFMNIIILMVMSLVISVIIKFFKKLFKCFSYIPILGKFNMFLGGIFGFLKSIVLISFISVIINSLISVSENRWTILNSQVINETSVLKKCDKIIKTDKIISFLDYLKQKF